MPWMLTTLCASLRSLGFDSPHLPRSPTSLPLALAPPTAANSQASVPRTSPQRTARPPPTFGTCPRSPLSATLPSSSFLPLSFPSASLPPRLLLLQEPKEYAFEHGVSAIDQEFVLDDAFLSSVDWPREMRTASVSTYPSLNAPEVVPSPSPTVPLLTLTLTFPPMITNCCFSFPWTTPAPSLSPRRLPPIPSSLPRPSSFATAKPPRSLFPFRPSRSCD